MSADLVAGPAESPARSDAQVSQAVLAATSAVSPPTPAAFVARLNDLRVEKELSYDRLGRRGKRRPELSMSRSGIYKMLKSDGLPTRQQLVAYLTLCDVPPREHTLWLTAYEQVEWAPLNRSVMQPAVSADSGAPEVELEPQPDAPGRETPGWHRPRGVWPHRRYPVWQGLFVVICSVFAAALTAVVLNALGLPPEFTAMTLVGAAGVVAAWTLKAVTPPPAEHLNLYVVDDADGLFGTDELVVVPVLGALDEMGR